MGSKNSERVQVVILSPPFSVALSTHQENMSCGSQTPLTACSAGVVRVLHCLDFESKAQQVNGSIDVIHSSIANISLKLGNLPNGGTPSLSQVHIIDRHCIKNIKNSGLFGPLP
ncbi:predicted protein [Histoplasma capsulatum G186AR]|uniref:Uncharacterized protein n=1 Tax=Ajellomyces capsulatus (strain G186AR / H82 / ATCC MYA-2454 / RMSCC 2432) TaxID=447093 RepID=C0NKV4_AJECG|nr:uncharacterized protein HCBG_03784 [Histoplasma capsulatum G186AR]EEH08495.1 predicted protein [Histoplasma capsulatum G186AR]